MRTEDWVKEVCFSHSVLSTQSSALILEAQ